VTLQESSAMLRLKGDSIPDKKASVSAT